MNSWVLFLSFFLFMHLQGEELKLPRCHSFCWLEVWIFSEKSNAFLTCFTSVPLASTRWWVWSFLREYKNTIYKGIAYFRLEGKNANILTLQQNRMGGPWKSNSRMLTSKCIQSWPSDLCLSAQGWAARRRYSRAQNPSLSQREPWPPSTALSATVLLSPSGGTNSILGKAPKH